MNLLEILKKNVYLRDDLWAEASCACLDKGSLVFEIHGDGHLFLQNCKKVFGISKNVLWSKILVPEMPIQYFGLNLKKIQGFRWLCARPWGTPPSRSAHEYHALEDHEPLAWNIKHQNTALEVVKKNSDTRDVKINKNRFWFWNVSFQNVDLENRISIRIMERWYREPPIFKMFKWIQKSIS